MKTKLSEPEMVRQFAGTMRTAPDQRRTTLYQMFDQMFPGTPPGVRIRVMDEARRLANRDRLRSRFSSRTWAVNVSINGEPVNHSLPEPPQFGLVKYWPMHGEEPDHAFLRLVAAVEEAAAKSLRGPTVLEIDRIDACTEHVVDWLRFQLELGREMQWPDGRRFEMDPQNLIVNLWLDEDDPATAEVVERIVGKSAGGTVAGMSKMPDHKPGRKEEPRAGPTPVGSEWRGVSDRACVEQ